MAARVPPERDLAPLQALTPARLHERVPEVTEAEARRLLSALHRELGPGAQLRNVRRSAREAVARVSHVPELRVVARAASDLDPFVKLLFEGADGARFEAVRIPLERPGRFSVCVSSQVGCALGCTFCETGRLGLRRNLEAWEIVEQIRAVRRTLDASAGQRVHGVVFQGMGEPLANADRVIEALHVLSNPSTLAIDARAITVCTAGLPAGIRRLAAETPNVRLAVSLGSARPDTRRRLMPITAAHPLEEVLAAAAEHARATGHSPLFAYIPLAGQTDTPADAEALAQLLHDFTTRAGRRPRLSLVPYNPGRSDSEHRRSDAPSEARFRALLAGHGVSAHRRYSGGSDVAAACGQLAATS